MPSDETCVVVGSKEVVLVDKRVVVLVLESVVGSLLEVLDVPVSLVEDGADVLEVLNTVVELPDAVGIDVLNVSVAFFVVDDVDSVKLLLVWVVLLVEEAGVLEAVVVLVVDISEADDVVVLLKVVVSKTLVVNDVVKVDLAVVVVGIVTVEVPAASKVAIYKF